MPKFSVTVSRTAYFQTTIEAADIDEAQSKARDMGEDDFEEVPGEGSWYVENVVLIPEHRYIVQTSTLCDGWTNTFTTYDEYGNGYPSSFETVQEAADEIQEIFDEQAALVASGEMELANAYDRAEYRIYDTQENIVVEQEA